MPDNECLRRSLQPAQPLAYYVFAGMCKILKEKERISHKEIAIDMGIDSSTLSKLLSGKLKISDMRKSTIYTYLNQERYAGYAPLLVDYLCDVYWKRKSDCVYENLLSKPYGELLYFLLFKYQAPDYEMQEQIWCRFVALVRSTLDELLHKDLDLVGGYELSPNMDLGGLEYHLQLPLGSVLVAERMTKALAIQRMYILICPRHWQREKDFLKDLLSRDSAGLQDYMIVRPEALGVESDSRIMHLLTEGMNGKEDPIQVYQYEHWAQRLAYYIFERLKTAQ